MSTAICESCGQRLPEKRLGAYMTPLKARIFDMVKRGGPDGVQADEIRAAIHDHKVISRNTLKVHINQINNAIEESGFRIYGRSGFYILRKRL